MRIKTKISLVILYAVILLAFFILATNLVFDLFHNRKYLDIVYKVTDKFAEWNSKYCSESLGPFVEYYVEAQANTLAESVKKIYSETGKNYNSLSSNEALRKSFLDSVNIKGIHGGYAALIYDKKEILMSCDTADEGMGLDWLLKGCSKEVRDQIFTPNPKKCVNSYFTYTDKYNDTYREYGSLHFIPDTKLMLLYCLSVSGYLKPSLQKMANNMQVEKEKMNNAFYSAFQAETEYEISFVIFSFIVVYVLSIPLIIKFSTSVSSPISKLRNEVQKLGRGSFNVSVGDSGIDEIQDLIKVFNYLGNELFEYMEHLKDEIIQRQRIEVGVNIARRIQESILPKITHTFTTEEFQLGARLLPAENVAGDFYDFFFANGKLVLCIADISGKGIAAAFFMSMTKILIKNLCFQHSTPDKVLFEANRTLSEGNLECMFATVFLCFIDIEAQTLTFSNAGHEDVMLIRNNYIRRIGRHKKAPLGVIADGKYILETIKLTCSDVLVFYTDGITDARSPDGTLFGSDNLEKTLMENEKLSPQDLCDFVIEKINSFEDSKLYDDVTIMIFKQNEICLR